MKTMFATAPVALASPDAVSAAPGAPRFVRGVKIHQPVVASNRDFIRAWAARRAKLARAARTSRI